MALLTSETAPAIGRLARGVPKPTRRKVVIPLSYEEEAQQRAVKRQLQLIAEQVAQTRGLLNSNDFRFCEHCQRHGVEPPHRAQLLRALNELLKSERELRQIAPPRPAPVQTKAARATITLTPEPQAVVVSPKPEKPAT